jgi:hypothetical protein
VNARPINSSTIEVSWDPPVDKDKNGVIRGYQIHVQPKNMVSCLFQDSNKIRIFMKRSCATQQTSQ